MISARQFLTDFLKDIVACAGERPAILEGYIKLMELREQSIAANKETLQEVKP